MIQTCNEEFWRHAYRKPGAAPCGRTFDDAERSTVCPHEKLPPKRTGWPFTTPERAEEECEHGVPRQGCYKCGYPVEPVGSAEAINAANEVARTAGDVSRLAPMPLTEDLAIADLSGEQKSITEQVVADARRFGDEDVDGHEDAQDGYCHGCQLPRDRCKCGTYRIADELAETAPVPPVEDLGCRHEDGSKEEKDEQ